MVARDQDQDRTGMKQVELSEEERNERARKQAAEQVELDQLYEMKRSHNRKWNEEIRQAEQRISQLAQEAEEGKAWVQAQTDMFSAPAAANTDDDEIVEPEDHPPPARRGGRRRRGAAAHADETAA